LIVAGVCVGGFLVAYKLKPAGVLPASKPRFCFLPKFSSSVALPPDVTEASSPQEQLISRLEKLGFSVVRQSEDELVFSRGSALGDFTVEIAKLDITFDLPIGPSTPVEVAYGSFAAFDTGDLWQFTQELKSQLEHTE
jgi:hypothetical protein